MSLHTVFISLVPKPCTSSFSVCTVLSYYEHSTACTDITKFSERERCCTVDLPVSYCLGDKCLTTCTKVLYCKLTTSEQLIACNMGML